MVGKSKPHSYIDCTRKIKVMKNTLKIIVGSLLVMSIIGGSIAALWIIAILQGNI
jgi:hypothetical protein